MTAELNTDSAAVTNRRAHAMHVFGPISFSRNHGQVIRVNAFCIVALVGYLMRLRVPQGQASTLLLGHRDDKMGIIQVVLAVNASFDFGVRCRGASARSCSHEACALGLDICRADLRVKPCKIGRTLPKKCVMSHN